ncbi:MAG TPA: M48 family metalloprotease, partial [Bryobacteraceae bacterium]|nr:M48 family metalloprotease [Bryobacteraceae bacterium]
KEMQLGSEIAGQIKSWGAEDPEASKYVTAVGEQLLPNLNRKAIHYQFHVIQSPEINAFAIPGGHIYVLTGLLDFLHSEAELASILGHEMSHVDLRHCIERYQYELALKKVGARDAGAIVGIAHQFASLGYAQYQELEADASGERLAVEAGYDPDGASAVFHRMKIRFGEQHARPAETPLGEVGQAVGGALGAYFQTHPPSEERARQLSEMVAKNHSTLASRTFYRGVRNYKEKIPRSARQFPAEKRVY